MKTKKRLKPKAVRNKALAPEELKAWRAFMNLTQVEAADTLGVSERSIENWEQGTRKPDHPGNIRKLMYAAHPKWKWPLKT